MKEGLQCLVCSAELISVNCNGINYQRCNNCGKVYRITIHYHSDGEQSILGTFIRDEQTINLVRGIENV
jgi:uncharacterized Zn finger protein